MKQLIFLSTILLLTVCAFGQKKEDSLTYKLNEYFLALTNLNKFNGNVIISKNGHLLLDKTYNMSNETDSLRVTRDSKFIIASVSKVFIKYSILKLIELNRLHLSDKLSKFIPDFPSGEKITVEQLMHHQSGLPRELKNYEKFDSLSLSKVVELAKSEKLQFEPGSQTLYSNVGYFLLHYIIDKTSDNGYLTFIHNEIFKKMELNNTLEFNSTILVPKFAYGFDNENGKVIPISKKNINKFETGNYLSTVGDLYRFSKQLMNRRSINQSLVNQLFNKDSVLEQAGGRPGYRAYFYMNLKTEVTFIFTSNYTDIPIQEVIADILNILSHKPYEVPHKINRVEIQLPKETLQKYTGKFALEADLTQTLTIALIGDKLYNVDTNGEKTELHPDGVNTFFENPTTKDGYIFTPDQLTNKFELTIIQTGLKLKAKRIE